MGFNAVEYLRYFGFSRVNKRGENYMASCPDFKGVHSRGDKRPSFGIHGVTGLNWCFACHSNMNVEQLTALLLTRAAGRRVNEMEAWDWLEKQGWLPSAPPLESVAGRLRGLLDTDVNEILSETCLEGFVHGVHSSIITNRGITVEAAKKWELKYDKETRRTIIPVRNCMRLLLGVMSRAVDDGSYLRHAVGIPKQGEQNKLTFKKGLVLYGEHMFAKKDTLLVVESPLDVVYSSSYGVDMEMDVCALFGSFASRFQMETIVRYPSVILALDNDEAGRSGTESLIQYLVGKTRVFTYDNAGEKDLGDVPCGELGYIRQNAKAVLKNKFSGISLKL